MDQSFLPTNRLKSGVWVITALAAAVWFLYFYPSQHPYQLITQERSPEEVRRWSQDQMEMFGYQTDKWTLKPTFRMHPELIERMQLYEGRDTFYQTYLDAERGESLPPPFYWRSDVVIPDTTRDLRDRIVIADDGESELDAGTEFFLDFSQQGKLVAFHNEQELIPEKYVDRPILADLKLISSPRLQNKQSPDTLLQRLLRFNLQKGELADLNATVPPAMLDSLSSRLERRIPTALNRSVATLMVRSQLERSIWQASHFRLDSLYTNDYRNFEGAIAELKSKKPILGQQISMDMAMAPTGQLIYLEPSYSAFDEATSGSDFWGVFRTIVFVLIAIFAFILFYRRLRIRVVDTRVGLWFALAGGVLVSVQSLLFFVNKITLETVPSFWEYVLIFAFIVGFSGAFTALSFFVLAGVSESVTREAWARKLEVYDLIRQGLLLNKPVGYAALRSVMMASIMAGIWTVFLQLNAGVAITMGETSSAVVFQSDSYLYPTIYQASRLSWISLGIIMLVCATLGSMIYNKFENSWSVFAVVTAGTAMIPIVPVGLTPVWQEMIGVAILAFVLAYIFIKWEVVTAALSLFLFLSALHLDSALIPPFSPDVNLLYLMSVFLIVLLGGGIWAVIQGPPDRGLPDYVPEYVEELAREQRMKQELEIAKRVQQDFLPLQTPGIEGWDVAAVCRPAYETGGDYYDFIPISEDKMAIAIGDVSGKGIEAAFYMTFVKGVLHSLAYEVDDAAGLMRKANRIFYDNAPRGTFISLIYGILDLRENKLQFARAGHNPVLYKPAGKEVKLLKPSGLGLGMNRGSVFDEKIRTQQISLNKGDLLILYTDGIVEAVNPRREFFGYDRFLRTFKEVSHLSAEQIIQHVSDGLYNFIGEAQQHDDMTMIVLKKM